MRLLQAWHLYSAPTLSPIIEKGGARNLKFKLHSIKSFLPISVDFNDLIFVPVLSGEINSEAVFSFIIVVLGSHIVTVIASRATEAIAWVQNWGPNEKQWIKDARRKEWQGSYIPVKRSGRICCHGFSAPVLQEITLSSMTRSLLCIPASISQSQQPSPRSSVIMLCLSSQNLRALLQLFKRWLGDVRVHSNTD